MRPKKNIRCILITALVGCFLLGISSCQHSLLSYKGAVVKEEHRIPLVEGGSRKGTWKTEDLQLDYEYSKKSDALEVTGVIEFDQHLAGNYNSLTDFTLQVFFTDSQGKILEEQILDTAFFKQDIEKMSIKKRLPLPQDAKAMVFGYRGRAEETTSKGKTVFGGREFWKTPLR